MYLEVSIDAGPTCFFQVSSESWAAIGDAGRELELIAHKIAFLLRPSDTDDLGTSDKGDLPCNLANSARSSRDDDGIASFWPDLHVHATIATQQGNNR